MKARRKGMDETIKINDPFIYSNQNSKPAKVKPKIVAKPIKKKINVQKVDPLILQTVLNDRAKISGKWYKKGSIIQGMRLSKLEPKLVTLKADGRTKLLLLNKKNRKITLSKH